MTFKVLGQSFPTLDTQTDIYTVPANKQAVVSSITVCNLDAVQDRFSIAVRPAGEALAQKHIVYFLEPVNGQVNYTITIGITMNETDVLTVYSELGLSAFSVFGQEI